MSSGKGAALRVLIIVNSQSGGGDAGLYDYVRALGSLRAEVTLRFTDQNTSIEDHIHDAASFDRIVAAGGDGTAGAACYAVRNTGIPVLVYPAGTANLLALNLNMPVEARALATLTVEGKHNSFDLGEIEHADTFGGENRTRGFAVMAGAGYDAAIISSSQPLKSTLGAAAYLVAAVTNLAPTASEFEIELDGELTQTDGIAVLIVNFGRLQFDLPVAYGADPRDGLFQVAVMRTRNVAGLIPAVVAAFSGAERVPGIDVYSAAHVTVSAYPQLQMQYDGELVDALTPFAAHILPGAVELLVPADSPFA